MVQGRLSLGFGDLMEDVRGFSAALYTLNALSQDYSSHQHKPLIRASDFTLSIRENSRKASHDGHNAEAFVIIAGSSAAMKLE
jgi:hypothetical protein